MLKLSCDSVTSKDLVEIKDLVKVKNDVKVAKLASTVTMILPVDNEFFLLILNISFYKT